MTKNKTEIAALAIDLKRIALGYHNGSTKTAERFTQEALKRKEEIGRRYEAEYINKILNTLPKTLSQKDKKRLAEDALMYSTIFQNYAIHNSS